jgi:hypothetical protein
MSAGVDTGNEGQVWEIIFGDASTYQVASFEGEPTVQNFCNGL